MYEVTSQSAQHALYSMSNWLGSVSDLHDSMPAPNVANKTAAKKTPEKKGEELGQKLARRRSQDFATKIQGWNQGGAGVAQKEDEVVVMEEKKETKGKGPKKDSGLVEVILDDSDGDVALEEVVSKAAEKSIADPGAMTKGGVQLAASAHKPRQADLDRKAWVRRKSKPQLDAAAEVKQAVAPKKRVVSDGHWRRDRLPKPEIPSPEKDTTPKPVTVRRSVVSVGLKVPPSTHDFVEEEHSPVRVRPLRQSRSRSQSRDREATPDYADSGVKVYVKRRRRSKTFDEQKNLSASQSSFTAGSSVERVASSTDVTTPAQSPTKATPPRPSTAPKETISTRPVEADEEGLRTNRRKSKTPVPAEGPTKNTPAKAVKRQAVPETPVVYGNRIEGWLAGTQDPFIDRHDPSLTPEPLEIPRKKSRRFEEDARGNTDRRTSSALRRSSKSSLQQQDSASPRDTAAPILRRHGARRAEHSPVKDRTVSQDADTATTVSDADLTRRISRRRAGRGVSGAGKRLSTIASVETLPPRRRSPSDDSDHPTIIPEGSILSHVSDGDTVRDHGTGLKRRMTKHSDLISVLSLPRGDGAGVKPARSVRTGRVQPNNATIGDLMNELTTDELKYQRELRTLVDGVIPVLLTYVLQKTDATGTKRLFSGSSPSGQAVTRPIVDMGVALEKLKATHKRIPLHDSDELIKWAHNASLKYAEYLKVWRLGFQDVVVNLAPAEGNEGSLRTANSEFTGGDGEKVDVQYLLKRPLVRLKYLAKTFRGIDQIKPSQATEEMGSKYQEMIQEARQRANDERARLEDEAAASIDPTRARDPRSLAPLAGVTIDPTRSVRARDYYDLEVVHSSGQQLMCKVELILRDDSPDRGTSSDILFCEVSLAGRWLLFPPIPASYVSARPGDKKGEIIVMVRGMLSGGKEWREIMSLRSDDEGTIAEWLGMTNDTPAPPRLTRQSSFNTLKQPHTMSEGIGHTSPIARPLSPSEVDVPIGERADDRAQQWDGSEVNSVVGDGSVITPLRRAKAKRHRSTPSSPITEDTYEQAHLRAFHIAKEERYDDPSGPSRSSKSHERPRSSHIPPKSDWTSGTHASGPSKGYSVWIPSECSTDHGSDSDPDEQDREIHARSTRPEMHRHTSSVPQKDMPTIQKLRKNPPSTPGQVFGQSPVSNQTSAPAKLQKRRTTPTKEGSGENESTTQAPATARTTSLGLRSGILPSFTPAFMKKHRRSSSPLKHEYEPSTASESLSDSDLSAIDDVESITSESSAEEEAISVIGPLKDFNNFGVFRPASQPTPPRSAYSAASGSVKPSESASQAPYRSLPPGGVQPSKTVACIFSWSDRGSWDSLHPEDCTIVVTPGLIEAFDMAQAHAVSPRSGNNLADSPSQRGVRPLVALELTPLVPLRRGTALDISIRSPPTTSSVIRTGNNVMFRSRSPEECERLYSLINRARIDNPTYIALQNARGPVAASNWAEVMDKRNAERTNGGSSWLRMGSRKGSTYRSKGSRAASTAATESSIGTVNSAFSALRRFNGSKSIFNIAKSTLTSREGTRSTYSDSLSSGAATPTPIDPRMGTPLGITNTKIRLYIRETASKWRDMGSARLTVMLPPRLDQGGPVDPRKTGMEKRILISGKSKGETLLDATLGESCFERVARTGIACSVWEEATGPNGEAIVGAVGGVSSARSKVYMIQMKSERDAAYTFGLVGKLRY